MKKVRIAVAIAANGDWMAVGAHDATDEAIIDTLYDNGIPVGAALRWIEADVPLPDVLTIEGKTV